VGGHRSGAKRRKKILVVPLHFFGFESTIISRFGERFRDGQYILVSFLCAVPLTVPPPCPAFVKMGGTCPRAHGVGATTLLVPEQ